MGVSIVQEQHESKEHHSPGRGSLSAVIQDLLDLQADQVLFP